MPRNTTSCAQIVPTRQTACRVLYPMYAMPVVDVLQLTRFQPHQELLNAGKLVEIQPHQGMDVIFVSHQWLSLQHPDPDNVGKHNVQGD
jgi:hypothetical protein